jgi:membrane-associated phospholipid phosphatase
MDLRFNMTVMEWLANHRQPWLTLLMQAASFMGEVEGYILICTLIYVAFDKTLAVRLALLVTLTMSLNHILKILIKNPRPFIREGDYLRKWAVSADYARDLAIEYSTPSGHAMAGASFYTFLYSAVCSPYVRTAAVLAALSIGLCRPYLGVHYVEDILLGWAIGLCIGLFALRNVERIEKAWNRLKYEWQITIAVIATIALWAATVALNGWRIDSQPRAFMGYAGVITGIVIARPLELRLIDFDPRTGSILFKVERYLISVLLALLTLKTLGRLFVDIADNYSLTGYVLQYIRYSAVSVVSLFVAPWIFTRAGLARLYHENSLNGAWK